MNKKQCDSTDCIYYNEDFECKCELEDRDENYDFDNCGDYVGDWLDPKDRISYGL